MAESCGQQDLGASRRAGEDVTGTIVAGEWVLTAAHETPRRDWAVRVVDGLIEEVGPAPDLRARHADDEYIDGAGCALLPGFVNSHVHLYGVLAHGVPAPAPAPSDFWGFLDDYWWPLVEDVLDVEMITAAADWVTAQLAASGTTSFFDILEAPNALPDALFAQREVVARRGLRAVLAFEATERMGAASGQAGLAENSRFIDSCGSDEHGADLVSGAMCIHTVFTCSEPFIRKAFDLACEHDVFFHAHVNEGVHEGRWCQQRHGMRTLEYYEGLGVASPRFQASQCVQLSPREIDIIADCGIRVSHMPLSNCEVGGGIAPVPELLHRDVTLGLGSDGYLNDMFAVMRGAFLVHRAATLDPGAITAAQVLHMATEGSALALGLERVGRLAAGWHADMQLVRLDGPAGLPTPVEEHNLMEQLVLWRGGAHVDKVMVAGDWIVEDAAVIGADMGQLRARTLEQAGRLWS